MIFHDESNIRIFLYSGQIDMRWGFERLNFLVREAFEDDIRNGDFYLFLGKNRKRLKALYFDKTGLILIKKRLEQGKFFDVLSINEHKTITKEELRLIISGAKPLFHKNKG